MNTSLKGKRAEKEVAEDMVSKGYIDEYYIAPRIKFYKNKDIFNLFDFVGISRRKPLVMFVQVKTGAKTHFYRAKNDIVKWVKSFSTNFTEVKFVLAYIEKGKTELTWLNGECKPVKREVPFLEDKK